MEREHVLVAGGGSGGHVFPALAVAEQMDERGWRVSWLGRVEGMERELVEGRGLRYYGLPAKAVVGRSIPARAMAITSLGASALRARRLIRRLEVGVVLGTGGYVSAPGVMGAVLARRPIVLLEPNAEPGVANRGLSRWATVAAVASSDTAAGLHCPVEETGVPVRGEFVSDHRPASSTGPLRLLVLGGSQGARQLNELLPPALQQLAAVHPGIEVTHQVGSALMDEARRAYEKHPVAGLQLSIVPFVEDVHQAMSAAHLVISRAGAITLAEICAVGRAALLLPLSLAGSHQVANARHLVAAAGAELLEPQDASVASLQEVLGMLLADRRRLRDMGQKSFDLARPRAATDVADLVERVARRV